MIKTVSTLALAVGIASTAWASPQDDAFRAATGEIHENLISGKKPNCFILFEPLAIIDTLASEGYQPALIYQGINLLHDQLCVAPNAAKGWSLLESVAAGAGENAATAKAYLGAEHYNHGDYRAALPLLQAGAKADVPVANHYLGSMYATGQGVMKSPRLALKYWSAAAVAGVAESQYNVALMYGNGIGVKKDLSIAAIELALCKDQLPGLDAPEQYDRIMAKLNSQERSYVTQTATGIQAELAAGRTAPHPEEIASRAACATKNCD